MGNCEKSQYYERQKEMVKNNTKEIEQPIK
jgi:hypothetical protein